MATSVAAAMSARFFTLFSAKVACGRRGRAGDVSAGYRRSARCRDGRLSAPAERSPGPWRRGVVARPVVPRELGFGRRVCFESADAKKLALPFSEDPSALGVYRSCVASGRGGVAGGLCPEGERLEFLGDAVLYMVCTDELFDGRDSTGGALLLSPREMHVRRVAHVRNDHLAEAGRRAGVDAIIARCDGARNRPGRGGFPTAAPSNKRVADSVEALIGAVYVLSGFDGAAAWVHRWVLPERFPGGSP